MSDTYSVFVDGKRVLSGAERAVAIERRKDEGPGAILAREEPDGPKEPTATSYGGYIVGPAPKKAPAKPTATKAKATKKGPAK